MASVIGVYAGVVFNHMREETEADFQRMMDWVDRDHVRPMVKSIYGFEQAGEGLSDIAARRAVSKSVARIDGAETAT